MVCGAYGKVLVWEGVESWHHAHLKEDVNSEKEAQPVSLAGIGSSVLQTSEPTESKGAPWVVSMGTSKLADQLGAKEGRNFILRTLQ